MQVLVPRPPQHVALDWILAHPRSALWAPMGGGKSSSALLAVDTLSVGGAFRGPALVIAPKRVARDTWPDEQAKWSQFKSMRVRYLQDPADFKKGADVFTTNYERLPKLIEYFGPKFPFKCVVADESDRLKGFRIKQGGERAHAIARVAHTIVEYWLNLSGTPAPNGLADLWGQTWFLDRGERLGRTYSMFMKRWFQKSWNGFGFTALPHAAAEIHAVLKDICLTIDAKDYFDLKDPIVTTVNIHLPAPVMKAYKALEKDMFAELADTDGGAMEIEVFNAGAKANKCMQMANGAVYTDYPNWKETHNEKLEALESICHENGGTPVLVSYQFKSDAARIQKAFPKATDISTPSGLRAFKAGTAPIGYAHPGSMGHGIDGLQNVTNTLVRFGHGWDMGQRAQMLERIGPMRQAQAGLDREVRVYDLVSTGTIDETIIARHETKRSVQDCLLAYMRRSN